MIKVHLGSIIYFVCVHDSTTLQHFFIFWISRCGKNVALLRDSAHVRGRNFCCSWHSLAHYYIVPRISGGNIKSHEAVKGGIKASINCLDYFLVHDITTSLDTTPWMIYWYGWLPMLVSYLITKYLQCLYICINVT